MDKKVTLYEQWYKNEDGDVIHHVYVMKKDGQPKTISFERTPYFEVPVIKVKLKGVI